MLDEKPELLERNDVSVFKRNIDQNYTSVSNNNMNRDEKREDKGDSTTTTFQKDTNEFQVDISDDFYEYLGDPGEKNKTDRSSTTPRSAKFENDIFLGSLGVNSFKLTPEEISSNAVKVEQMLEDYNSSK